MVSDTSRKYRNSGHKTRALTMSFIQKKLSALKKLGVFQELISPAGYFLFLILQQQQQVVDRGTRLRRIRKFKQSNQFL